MCGICGIYRLGDGAIRLDALRTMNSRMIRRGPDDEGYYTNGPVGLGIRRLSIIDVAGGHQPISNEDESVWVVMNGEIYNHVELRSELQRKGHHFRTSSDTEILVHLYEEEGTDGIHQLNGMFGFALYDVKKQALWIARDRLGIKPVFYSTNDSSLFFASDLHALVSALPGSEINTTSFLRYLAAGYVPEPDTIYSGIKKLSPGHWIWASREAFKIEKYWSVSNLRSWRGSVEDAAARLYELLDDAVRLQLRSDVPLGVFLSGGVDSTSVVALAAKKVRAPIATFTANFVNKPSADVDFARQAAAKFATNHTEISLPASDGIKALRQLIPLLDEPVADSALIPSYLISEAARSRGIKVLLTGAGGDEIFGGYHRHHRPRVGNSAWLAESLPAALRPLVAAAIGIIDRDRAIEASDPRVALGVGISGVSLNQCRLLLNHRSDFEKILTCLHELYGDISLNGEGPGYAYTRMLIDLRQYLVGNILALTDKASMACSVEARVPLLDHRLVEFAFELPDTLNLLEEKPKGLLRAALKKTLPDSFLARRKEGFNAPMDLWVLGEGAAEIEDELIVNPIPLYNELLNLAELRNLLKQRRTARTAETIFSLFIFSRWYRTHANGKTD